MNPHLADSDFTLYVGDVRDVLAELPAESVHCVVTSPPYWGLRDYGTDGQLGLEPTPREYVQNMVDVFRQVRRVLRDDGTLWLNLGDSYAGSWGNQGRKDERGTQRPINGDMLTPVHDGRYPDKGSNTGAVPLGLKPKDLVGIPWRVAFALQDDGWYLRSDIIWAKPNPMPESVTDRPTKAHEYLFLLTKQPRYYFDQEAVREAHKPSTIARGEYGHSSAFKGQFNGSPTDERYQGGKQYDRLADAMNPAGRNVRSVWEIATQPYPDAHFATFPEELPRRCIVAGTSEHGVCPECGAPWERVVEREIGREPRHTPSFANHHGQGKDGRDGSHAWIESVKTTGWRPTCSMHPDRWTADEFQPVPATVLDPFAGSGTTNHVARKHGRRSIGIELNPAYANLCAQRMSQLSLLT